MHCFLSIKNLLLGLLFALHTTVLAQTVELPVIRQKGASLDTSIANEADHAIRQARTWLRANPPANFATQTCALVRLALHRATPATNLMALAATAGLFARTNQTETLLAACLAAYPPKTCDPEALWLVGRAINQNRKGLLLRKTEALDWRNDFAQLLICSQRSDPAGGAYWEPPRLDRDVSALPFDPARWGDGVPAEPPQTAQDMPVGPKPPPETRMLARIRATAYGILALKEIHE